jgi:hypothetical protein
MLSILPGLGDGTFGPPTVVPIGQPGTVPSAVTAGDFYGDGNLDLAVTNYPLPNGPWASVTIYRGNGDGTFEEGQTVRVGSRSYSGPESITAADLGQRGVLDLVVANWLDRGISVLRGNGDGTFRDAVNYVTQDGAFSVAVGDFNGDGYPDLAVANYYGTYMSQNGLSVLLNNGDGTFRPAGTYGVYNYPWAVAAGDFRGVGVLDLVVANNASNDVEILQGNGDGTFRITARLGAGGVGTNAVVTGDFNGDGVLDFAVANAGSDNVGVFIGRGDGTFHLTTFAAGRLPFGMIAADLNGDGAPDLVALNGDPYHDTATVLLNDGTRPGAWRRPEAGQTERLPDARTGTPPARADGQPSPVTFILPARARRGWSSWSADGGWSWVEAVPGTSEV